MRLNRILTAGCATAILFASAGCGTRLYLYPETKTYSAILPLIEKQYLVVFDTKSCLDSACATFEQRYLGAMEKIGIATLDRSHNLLSIQALEIKAATSLRSEKLPNDLESACLVANDSSSGRFRTVLVAESGGDKKIARILKLDLRKSSIGWRAKAMEVWRVQWKNDPFKGFEGMACNLREDGSIEVWFATRGYHPAWPAFPADTAEIYQLFLNPGGGNLDLSTADTFDVTFGNPTARTYQAGQTFAGPGFLHCSKPVSMDKYAKNKKDEVASQRDISDLHFRHFNGRRELWASATFDGAQSESYCSAIYRLCEYSTCLRHFNNGKLMQISANTATITLDSNKIEGFIFHDPLDTSKALVATDEEESGIIGIMQ